MSGVKKPNSYAKDSEDLKKNIAESSVDTDVKNIDRIRDILFGTYVDEYEKRFTKLEEKLIKESKKLRDDMGKKLSSLEQTMKDEVKTINSRIHTDQEGNSKTFEKVSKEILKSTESLNEKILELGDNFSNRYDELHHQIMEESKTLNNEINNRYNEVSNIIEESTTELNKEKTDRIMLSNLLKEISERLLD